MYFFVGNLLLIQFLSYYLYENFSLASAWVNLDTVVLSDAIQAYTDTHLSVEAENVDFKEENRILSAVPQKG